MRIRGLLRYLWAEVLDHDAFEAFTEAGGPYDKAVAKRLHDDIMRVGNGVDPARRIGIFAAPIRRSTACCGRADSLLNRDKFKQTKFKRSDGYAGDWSKTIPNIS